MAISVLHILLLIYQQVFDYRQRNKGDYVKKILHKAQKTRKNDYLN